MEGKKTRGRQKIPMVKIENEANRYVSFCKRRSTLYKNVSELVNQCNVDIGIILFYSKDKPFAFFHPTPEAVIDRFLDLHAPLSETTCLVAAHVRNKVNELIRMTKELDKTEEATNKQALAYKKMKEVHHKGWLESIEQLNEDEIIKLEAWLKATAFNMDRCLKQLKNDASTSSLLENADNEHSPF